MKTFVTVILGLVTLVAAALFLLSSFCAVAGGTGFMAPGVAIALVSLAVAVGCLLCIANMYEKEPPKPAVTADETVTGPQPQHHGNE